MRGQHHVLLRGRRARRDCAQQYLPQHWHVPPPGQPWTVRCVCGRAPCALGPGLVQLLNSRALLPSHAPSTPLHPPSSVSRNWQHDSCVYNATWTGRLIQELFDVNYTQPPYSTTFPELVDTLNRRMCTPVNVSYTGNRGCNVTRMIDMSLADLASYGDVYADNTNTSQC